MNDHDLDALLNDPLPERDAADFSVALMEHIAHDAARPARIAAWIMAGVLTVIVAAAVLLLAQFAGEAPATLPPYAVPSALVLLTLLLSFAVMRSVRE